MDHKEHPNLLFVFADQLRYQSCGYAGAETAHTPNIDAFSRESLSFPQAVSVFPVCAPYRNSLFTGRYPSSTGMFDNGYRCMHDPSALGYLLSQAGYRTGYIGKWHLMNGGSDAFIPPGETRLGFDQLWQAYNWNHDYNNGFYYQDTPERIPLSGYQPFAQTELVESFLRGNAQDPFALIVSYEVPHPPNSYAQCPKDRDYGIRERPIAIPHNREPELFRGSHKKDDDWFEKEWYSAMEERVHSYRIQTAAFDDAAGRILRVLEETGKAENTVVVVTADHGEMLYSHNRMQKRIFYEESLRVPFLVRWPGVIRGNRSSDACMNTPDIMPTLLDLMRIPIPSGVEGKSRVPDISAPPSDDYAFLQGMSESSFFADEEWRGVRSAGYHYVRTRKPQQEFFFDLDIDPLQTYNHASRPECQDALAMMRAKLDNELVEHGDEFRSTSWYRENWIKDMCVTQSAKRSRST